MSLEIEIKLKVNSHEVIRQRLTALGANRLRTVLETNHLLDDVNRGLRDTGQGLRIRQIQLWDGSPQQATLTYKGPMKQTGVKIREEFQIEINDPTSALQIFQSLGYAPYLVFEKKRESWRLNDCQVELDELPLLGWFVEIEGPSESAIKQAKQALELAHQTNIPQTYVHMLLAFCESAGIPSRIIRFPAGSGQF